MFKSIKKEYEQIAKICKEQGRLEVKTDILKIINAGDDALPKIKDYILKKE